MCDQTVAVTLGPIPELILEDQDPPLLLGDLVDLVAQLLVEALERLLDVGRVQRQRGDRAERPRNAISSSS